MEYTDVMKKTNLSTPKNKRNYRRNAALSILLLSCLLLTSCGHTEQKSVEEEVYERLQEAIPPIEENATADTGTGDAADTDTAANTGDVSQEAGSSSGSQTSVTESGTGTNDDKPASPTATPGGGSSASKLAEKAKNVNPFLGDTSTSTVFNIKFSIETDSGVAGVTFGSDDGTDGEYYLFAFDCTKEFPYLYTSRRIDDAVYDEVYTPLDFMYPKMDMFTTVEHIVEIKVNGNIASTYLDSYKVCDTTLNSAKSCGQFGTWVMDGNYHEYIDNLFVAEGIEGDGEWIYSDDFAQTSNLFYPDLKPRAGRLYAKSGYYTAPHKDK